MTTKKREPEADLDLAGDRCPVLQRLGHGDPHGPLQGFLVVEAVGRGLPEAGSRVRREDRGVRGMRLQQDPAIGVAHDVGEELVVLADGGETLHGSPSSSRPTMSMTASGRRRCAVSCRAESKTSSISCRTTSAVTAAAPIQRSVSRMPIDSPSRA